MNDRSPGRPWLGVLLLMGAGLAPWLAIVAGRGAAAAAALATVCAAAAWWGFRRDAARQRDADQAVHAMLVRLVKGVGRADASPSSVEEAVAGLESRLSELRGAWRTGEEILDALEAPVIALDRRATIIRANRSALALLAPGAGLAAVGRGLDEVLPDERALSVVRRALGGEPGRGRVKLLTGEGPRIVEVAAEPIVAGGGDAPGSPAVVVMLRDITEQATAMQLKTDFVANASHELRTPLASIKTAAETLADLGDASPGTRTRLVSMIASNAERLEELARDLLDLSSLESPETDCVIERVDLFDLADDLRELFETPCVQRRVSLVFDLDERLETIWTDARLLRLILRNLIDNAVKFAYENTTVLVRGAAAAPGGQRASCRLAARLEVIDRGIGIPLAQQQRIFERFFQIDAARSGAPGRRGTGLGLAIVKHALRAIGGSIQVSSVWRQGTTMTVDLPECIEPGAVTTEPG